MARPQTSNGNVFYRKDRNRWIAKYFVKDYNTGKMITKRKRIVIVGLLNIL